MLAAGGCPNALCRRDYSFAIVVFTLAAIWVFLYSGGKAGFGPDGATALHTAQNIASGNGIVVTEFRMGNIALESRPTVTKPPLYASCIGALIWLGIAPVNAGGIITAAAWAAAVAILFLLARQVLSLPSAILVPLCFALQTTSLRWGITIQEQSLFVAFCFATLLQLSKLSCRRDVAHWIQYGLLGALSSLAILASYQAFPLLLVTGFYVVLFAYSTGRITPATGFFTGSFLIAAWPFLRFVQLWIMGIRPGFEVASDTSYYNILAGIVSAFQNDILGSLIVWLYDGSASDIVIMTSFFLFLSSLVAYSGWRKRELRPLSFFTFLYIVMLVVQLGGNGKHIFEPRYNLPVYGLIFIFMIFVVFDLFKRLKIRYSLALAVGTLATSLFAYGQNSRYSTLLGGHHEYCPAPLTINWIRANLPRNSIVAAPQCGYQLIAKEIGYYWLKIPPAGDLHSLERWTEGDFQKACTMSNEVWVVLFKGKKEDPFRQNPGYGPLVEQLFRGEPTTEIEMAARLDDGLIYRLNCNRNHPI